jgi:protein O-GlcNAc transferase
MKTDKHPAPRETGVHPLLPNAAALHQAGRLDEAAKVYESILLEMPQHFDAMHLLGVIALQQGRLEDAQGKISAALTVKPDDQAALVNLTAAYLRGGKFELAAESGERAVRILPPSVDALINYGAALHQVGRYREAIGPLESAYQENQRSTVVCNLLGSCLMKVGEFPKAAAKFEIATIVAPMDSDGWANLSTALHAMSQHARALTCAEKAVALGRDTSNALAAQAAALLDLGKIEESITIYQRAAALNPTISILCELARALITSGRNDDAIPYLQRAIEVDELNPFPRMLLAISLIKTIYRSTAEVEASRAAFMQAIRDLHIWYAGTAVKDAYAAVGASQPFFAAYHPFNNKDLLTPYGELCVSWMKSLPNAGSAPSVRPHGGKIRIGIVSAHVRDQSVWNAIIRGWIYHLDKSKLDVYLFKLESPADQETRAAISEVTHFDDQPKSLFGWVEAIRKAELDALIYDEIGMDARTLQLAAIRLAPLQAATWGHPETTGLPSIDFYLSGAGIEPPNAQDHYTERLIQLPNMGVYVEPLKPKVQDPKLRALGLPRDEPLLLCPGSLFKYSPLSDWVWIEIAKGLKMAGGGRLVFFINTSGSMHLLLTERLRASFARENVDFDAHVCLIPLLDRPRYFGLMERSTLMLDTLGFSGFNTALQAIEIGLPYLAFEGNFMRGRLASGIMRRLDLPELVATTYEDFVRRAVALAADKGRLKHLRSEIAKRRHILFSDTAPIRALEEFLVDEIGKRRAKEDSGAARDF